ncbi:MAG: hypothetical protein JNL58_16645 [Planctomyces sp.]|nr:hypothetical protein [Planctomyces sp.]
MRIGSQRNLAVRLTYINRKGEPVQLEVSGHARGRFRERWQHAFPGKPVPSDFDQELKVWFSKAKRTEPTSRKYQTRLKRYGKDTLYFFAPPFMFVVQSAMLRTVELASRDTRPLNNKRPISADDASCSDDSLIACELTPEQVCEAIPGYCVNFEEPHREPVESAHSRKNPGGAAPNIVGGYKLLIGATDENRSVKFINLGTYPSDGTNGDARQLLDIPEFLPEVRERFRTKRPGWFLLTIYATLGKHGEQVRVYDEISPP